jgi:hypothetical protein
LALVPDLGNQKPPNGKEPEPALVASESDVIGGEKRLFTAKVPGRKVEPENHKVGEQRGSAASYCR